MPDHRVPMLGDGWRHPTKHRDPQFSRDPQIRALVSDLRAVAIGPAPEATFRDELRAQLVAITPRILSETAEAATAMVDIVPRPVQAPVPAVKIQETVRRFRVGRVLGAATCVMAALALLLGGAVVLSHRALPGDTLYGLKRASEQFELDTDGSNTERAADLLSFAGIRADEAQQLIDRASSSGSGSGSGAAGPLDANTVSLISSTLASANSDVRDASSLLTRQAVSDESPVALSTMTNWAPQQQARLDDLYASTSDSSVRAQAKHSAALVGAAQVRAKDLIGSVDCSCMSHARSDSLGPEPCRVCPIPSTPSTTTPARSMGPTAARTTAPGKVGSTVHPVTGSPVGVPSSPLSGASTPKSGSSQLYPIPSNLPTPPTSVRTPSPPISVSSCGVTLTVPGLGLTTCPTGSSKP